MLLIAFVYIGNIKIIGYPVFGDEKNVETNF